MPMIDLFPQERYRSKAVLATFAALLVIGGPARTETIRQVLPGAPAVEAPQEPASEKSPDQSEIQRFCSNIADAARDRRYALQAQELKQLQAAIDQRMQALENKRAEYETW